jgi:hypothetical protein
MKGTTSRSEARAALLKKQAAAAEERKRREVQNVSDLTTFVVEAGKLDGVDEWEHARVEKLHHEAERKRDKHRANAGRALQAMRFRGESIASIAEQAGVSVAVVRGFLQTAAQGTPASVSDSDDGARQADAAAMANKENLPQRGRSAATSDVNAG